LEQKLLAAFLKSREVFTLVWPHLGAGKGYSEEFGFVVQRIEEYYRKDESATRVDCDVLVGLMEPRLKSKKQFDYVRDYTQAAAAITQEVSAENVGDLVLSARKYEVGNSLAAALLEGNNKAIKELMAEFSYLDGLTGEDVLNSDEGMEIYEGETLDLASILFEATDVSKKYKLYPKPLHEATGGVSPQDHILVFGIPEIGKSAMWMTMVAGFLHQGLKVLVVENEDATKKTITRIVSCLTQVTAQGMVGQLESVVERAVQRGFRNLNVVGASPGTPSQLEALADRYKPDVMVVNQIHNIAQSMKGDNHVLKLLAIATFMRNLGKKRNQIQISITQAEEAAAGKAVLNLNDVYFSNTAVQGAVDLMIGVGGTAEHIAQGTRVLSLPKNKLSGLHSHFPVSLNHQLSTMRGIE
jgi:archaellum biogenesis ATPase FlaH